LVRLYVCVLVCLYVWITNGPRKVKRKPPRRAVRRTQARRAAQALAPGLHGCDEAPHPMFQAPAVAGHPPVHEWRVVVSCLAWKTGWSPSLHMVEIQVRRSH
jgi:hypothetical protein